MPVREVAFELECFEWADERLEVAGRWKGLAGRRLNRPVLTVEIEGGRRKHLVAMPGGHFAAAEESWRAAFDWPGDPGEITGAELEVGGNVVVDLPLPDRKRRRRRSKPQPVETGDDGLRNEIAALRGQVERLRGELAGRERENMYLREQLVEDDAGDPAEPLVSEAHDATIEIRRHELPVDVELARLADERDRTRSELSAEVERLHAERDRLEQESAHTRADVDDLREAFAEAAAEAEEVRDRHQAELAALRDELRAERATVARLTAELAAGPELPPPATSWGRRRRGGGVAPIGPEVEPVAELPDEDDDSFSPVTEGVGYDHRAGGDAEAVDASNPVTEADPVGSDEPDTEEVARREAAAAPPTQPLNPVQPTEEPLPAVLEAVSVPDVLDPPGPLRAGGRPASQPGVEDGARPSRIPAWLRAGRGERDDEEETEEAAEPAAPPLQALKERLEGLFSSNGHAAAEDATEDAYEPVPAPRRSAAAARARAGATVAARRSPMELWGARIVAAVLVAMLLVAFLLILTSIA